MWDAEKLPFLEEKLEFRRSFIERLALPRSSRVLCLYGGGEGLLTEWYARQFDDVTAVDLKFKRTIPGVRQEIWRVERYLENASVKGERYDIIDADPYGSPFPALKDAVDLIDRYAVILATDGFLTHVHFKRRADVYCRYGISRPGVIACEVWHKRWFECVFFARLAGLARERGYTITAFDAVRNRYGLALYAGAVLEKVNLQ